MIERLDISGVHTEATDDLKKYVTRKIGKLDRFISRHARESVHAEVKLKEGKARDKNERTCEVIMHLPGEIITVKETTVNMFAAIDIVETKLRGQLKKYKELHTSPRLHQRLLTKLKHRPMPAD